jgi:Domain of unknown function (DUF2382)
MNSSLNDSDHNFPSQTTQAQEKRVALPIDDLAFRLLEERLVIDRSKRKIGEVIVRKEVHTRLVEVPVRYERLIVEQVSPNLQQLAAIDLGYGEVTGIDPDLQSTDGSWQKSEDTVGLRVNFNSLEYANQFLEELAQMLRTSDESPQIEIVLKDQNSQAAYLSWLDRQNY